MRDKFEVLDVKDIDFDSENPRIKKALEKYGDKVTAEKISFALRTASDDASATSTFTRLRDSIRANGGITQPITVISHEDRYTCIDGNTRLAIYQEFANEETEGDWQSIPALVIEDPTIKDIETVRVSAHLVGPREWPAYEKARYLHYLYHQKFLEFGEMVILCGGNQKEIERQIEAYEDMNAYYRDKVDDTAFHIDRFSGFVELQKPGVKDAILEAGFTLDDFGEWIRDGNIKRLADVRLLKKVLKNSDATKLFTEGGIGSIEKAIKLIDKQEQESSQIDPKKSTLQSASLYVLTSFLARRVDEMPFLTMEALRNGESQEDEDTVLAFQDLYDKLESFLKYVGKS